MIIKSEHIGSTVPVQIGLWENQICVFYSLKAFKILSEIGIGLGNGIGFVPYWRGRTFCMEYSREDICHHINSSTEQQSLPYRTQFQMSAKMARCVTMETYATIKSNCLEIEICKDHLLPWPSLRDCKTYQKVEVARREINLRLQSARKSCAIFHLADIPPEFQVLISAKERIAVVESEYK